MGDDLVRELVRKPIAVFQLEPGVGSQFREPIELVDDLSDPDVRMFLDQVLDAGDVLMRVR